MRHLQLVTIMSFALALVSCEGNRMTIFRSNAPDGATEVQLITYSRLLKPGTFLRAELTDSRGSRVVGEWYQNDFGLCFADAAWSSNSQLVAVLWRNCYHGTEFVAYDRTTGALQDSGVMMALLREKVRSDYHLPATVTDAITWTKTTEAQTAFARRQN